ncbi:Zygote arrest protein 1 [Bagarius yarrelli]|uniref:Zygote arrest protein 1 n=1 Tax=Bagarius yarrelli TaxID=175774 RepID=A0A556VAC3_BAGYA|nr:Zygote arrest protein 1 [Bagarius yarrelli]
MEALTFSAYSYGGYPGYIPFYQGNPKVKHQNWNKKGVFGVVPEIPDYFEICKRAQLKAILSQVNPNLTPRLRKANTKDFGVQVNPKVNATVQCSLGPKTLFYQEDSWASPKTGSPLSPSLPSTPLINVRFSRPVAIYSPVFDRRFFSLPARADEPDNDAKLDRSAEENCAAEVETRESEAENVPVKARHAAPQSRTSTKFKFQFLEQKYGYYHCGKCNIRWESAYVWCISGTCKVYFKQHCRKCQAGLNPYRVESIQCQVCARTRCCCELRQRHIDVRRPHRQDLCGRCKGKRLSCDTTYSFKYIV